MLRFPRRKTLPSTPSNDTSHEASVPILNTEVFSKTNSSLYFLKPLKSVGGCSYTSKTISSFNFFKSFKAGGGCSNTSYRLFLKYKLSLILLQILQVGRRVFLHFILRIPQIRMFPSTSSNL